MTSPLRRKRYSLVVVSLLTLVFVGIGAVVGMMTSTTFRPLPFTDADHLAQYYQIVDGNAELWESDSLARTTRLVPEIIGSAAYMSTTATLAYGAIEKPVQVVVTSPNFATTLGLHADRPGAANVYATTPGVAIISRTLARSLEMSPESAPGRQIRVDGKDLTIVALFDRERAFPADGDVWYADPGRRGNVWMGLARLSSGTTLDAVRDRLGLALRVVRGDRSRSGVHLTALADVARPSMPAEQRSLVAGIIIFAAIAILNYGLLGVGEARRRLQEFAIRVAVGASRAQVARRVFIDQLTLVFSSMGIAAAFFIFAGLALPADSAIQLPRQLPLAIWGTIVGAFALLIGTAALPTGVARAAGEMDVLRRSNARGSQFERTWNRVFIGLQFAVTAFLLVAGGIAAMTLARSRQTNYGFDPANALVGTISYRTPLLMEDAPAKLASFQIVADLHAALPDYRVAAWGRSGRTMGGGRIPYAIDPQIAGRPGGAGYVPWSAQDVTADFFRVVGIPIIAGRAFRESDDSHSEPVIILGEVTARRLWGVESAVGKRMRFGEDDAEWRRVIGVAADAYPIEGFAFTRQAAAHFAKGIVYRPLAQVTPRALAIPYCKLKDGTCVGFRTGLSIIVKGSDVDATIPRIRSVIARAAPGEDFAYLGPLARFLDGSGEIERGEFTTNLLIAFALAGFVLALLGVIVLIDEVVRNRTSEIGIRRALGAQSASLVILASRETFVAGVTGVVAGSLAGLRIGPFVATWMKANPSARILPPPTVSYALVLATAVTLLIMLAIGTAARAMSAARLDPAAALRIE